MEENKIEKLYQEIVNTISETPNEDDAIEQLEKAMEYFCSTWDKCEGFKHAILETLNDQFENHQEDLTEEELKELLSILNK